MPTTTAPAAWAASAATNHRARLGPRIATRSPGSIPAAIIARAICRTRSSCSAQLIARQLPASCSWTAGTFGLRAPRSINASMMVGIRLLLAPELVEHGLHGGHDQRVGGVEKLGLAAGRLAQRTELDRWADALADLDRPRQRGRIEAADAEPEPQRVVAGPGQPLGHSIAVVEAEVGIVDAGRDHGDQR